jgi:hypothetical protein
MRKKIAHASLCCGILLASVPNAAGALPLSGVSHGHEVAVVDHRLLQNVHGWRRAWGWGAPYNYGYGYRYYRPYAYYRRHYYGYYAPYYRVPYYPVYFYYPPYYPYY